MHIRVLDRFDKIAVGVIAGLLVMIGAIVVRGDQLGIRLVAFSPTGSASSRTNVQMTFDEPIDQAVVAPHFVLAPPVQGSFLVANGQVTFRPSQAFQPGIAYQVTVTAGLASTTGRALKQDAHWQFRIRPPSVVSLGPQDQPPWNLYLTDPASPDHPQQITSSSLGITSFEVLPDGSNIVYAEQADSGTSTLYVWDQASNQSSVLYQCDNARCLQPVWRPDGGAVAFEHIANTGTVLTVPRIWLYDVATNTAQQLLRDNQITGQQPRWSPDGSKLAFSEIDTAAIRIHDFSTGKDSLIPSAKGEIANFSPDGKWLVLQKAVAPAAGQRATHLVLVDIASSAPTRHAILPDTDPRNDEAAIWADAHTLIVMRSASSSAQDTTGTQIYSVDVNTGVTKPLLADQGYSYLGLTLSPTGDALLVQRLAVGKPGTTATTFLYTLSSGKLSPLLENQSDPAWLP